MELAGEYHKEASPPEGKKDYGVVAMDLHGGEVSFSRPMAQTVWKAADKEIPFSFMWRAGGAAEVACAIEMGAARIGHGVRSYGRIRRWCA